jgi:hypothetical protein
LIDVCFVLKKKKNNESGSNFVDTLRLKKCWVVSMMMIHIAKKKDN